MIPAIAAAIAPSAIAQAQDLPTSFETGPVFEDFGPAAEAPGATPLPEGAEFRIAFDAAKRAEEDKYNKTLESAARFMNMHARAGVATDNISLAVVIHGGAVNDVTKSASDRNVALVAALIEKNVRIIVCGQSAVAYGVTKEHLSPGVELALSAMTAHALLQQDGYTLNPF